MLLLDTHAVLWLDGGLPMDKRALRALEAERQEGGVIVSAVSAWEIATLVRKNRLVLNATPRAWLERFIGLPGIRFAPLSLEAASGSASLPEPFHSDPADRLLVAVAREHAARFVTRDSRIAAFALSTGYIEVLGC
jgi:PIN domain nuclease of toxin-antitoxin system